MARKEIYSKNSCLIASVLAISVLFGCAETRALKPLPAPTVPSTVSETPVTEEVRPATQWSTNKEAISIIKQAEGLRLHAYHLAGQVLIGYGHAVAYDDEATPADEDLTISEQEAQNLLRGDVTICESAVRHSLKVDVTRNQFSAMVAFCYNVGQATFMNSSILRHVNQGETARAADAFLLYDKTTLDTEKRTVVVLAERRIKERYLFLASSPSPSPPIEMQLRRS